MLKICNFSVKYAGYRYVKKVFRLYNATETCQYWSKKDYIVGSWEAGDEVMPAGYYYWSCHTTRVAAEKKATTLQAGKVFHRSQIVFCQANEF